MNETDILRAAEQGGQQAAVLALFLYWLFFYVLPFLLKRIFKVFSFVNPLGFFKHSVQRDQFISRDSAHQEPPVVQAHSEPVHDAHDAQPQNNLRPSANGGQW